MGKLSKISGWCWNNYDKLLQIGALVVSFGVPAWAAFASPFISAYAPLSWVAAGFIGLLSLSLVMCFGAWAYARFIQARWTTTIIKQSGVNPLEDRFERQIIRLSDFYHPHYIEHANQDFRKCQIAGPGLVYFKNVSFDHCEFKHVQIVVVADQKTMWGMTIFESPKFLNCEILNLTMMMNRASYDALPPEMKAYVPVINGSYP